MQKKEKMKFKKVVALVMACCMILAVSCMTRAEDTAATEEDAMSEYGLMMNDIWNEKIASYQEPANKKSSVF